MIFRFLAPIIFVSVIFSAGYFVGAAVKDYELGERVGESLATHQQLYDESAYGNFIFSKDIEVYPPCISGQSLDWFQAEFRSYYDSFYKTMYEFTFHRDTRHQPKQRDIIRFEFQPWAMDIHAHLLEKEDQFDEFYDSYVRIMDLSIEVMEHAYFAYRDNDRDRYDEYMITHQDLIKEIKRNPRTRFILE